MTLSLIRIVGSLSRGPITVDEAAGVLIPNVKFPTTLSLGSIEGGGTTYKIKYLTERWNWFNTHLFGGVMKQPKFEITRSMPDIKQFGSWQPGTRILRMHPKLWALKSEAQCLGTLVHEMAHQYEGEHNRRPSGGVCARFYLAIDHEQHWSAD